MIVIPFATGWVRELPFQLPDIRSILVANSLRDMLADDDMRFIRTVNQALGVPHSLIIGGITRETLADAARLARADR